MITKVLTLFFLICYCAVFCCCISNDSNSDRTKFISESNVTVYCVTPVNGDALDDGNCQAFNATQYHSLMYYMTHSLEYFNSNQIYIFEIGCHTPLDNFILRINDTANLVLTGPTKDSANSENAAIIDCNGRATGLVFEDSSNVTIENLTFLSCIPQNNYKSNNYGKSTLLLSYCSDIILSGVVIVASADQGFYILEPTGKVILNDMHIANSYITGRAVKYSGNTIAFQSSTWSHGNYTLSSVYITNSRFINNTNVAKKRNNHHEYGAAGLSIFIKRPNVHIAMVNVTMSNNTGNEGGNLAISFQSYSNVFVEIRHSCFEGGKSTKGGGISVEFIQENNAICARVEKHRLFHVYSTNITENLATSDGGGGVYIKLRQSLQNCTEEQITFENVIFNNNSIINTEYGAGIAIHSLTFVVIGYVYHGGPQFEVLVVHCNVSNNNILNHEVGNSGTGAIFLNSNPNFKLHDICVLNNNVTGIVGINSNVVFSGRITISNNTGSSGGGILLHENAVVYFEKHTNVTIAHNSAQSTGGGICVESSDYVDSQEICFFQVGYTVYINTSLLDTITASVYGNRAELAGDNIFGGSIDRCYMYHSPSYNIAYKSIYIFHTIFKLPSNTQSISGSSISSPPRNICLCQNHRPKCHGHLPSLRKFPGETFYIEAVLVGQFDGTVPGIVQADLKFRNSTLQQGEYIQKLSSLTCKQLKYTIKTNYKHEVLVIQVHYDGGVSGFIHQFKRYYINVHMKECPLGFTRTDGLCNCSLLLIKNKDHVSCDITTRTVKRLPPVWIGVIKSEKESKYNIVTIAYHRNCPLDYCASEEINLTAAKDFLSQDDQCAFSRTGVLCGSCQTGLSAIIGSSKCCSCSNYWLLLIVPYGLLGVLLLVMMLLFDITIAEGTLSGIIFYCNIIAGNLSVFFKGRHITILTHLLKMFISFVSLESSISTCLFNGMTSYIKAWLDFTFPLYIWFLTGIFIFLGGKCSWIVRRNAVKVLATLILLSYTRLLTSIAGALQLAHIQLENGDTEMRWLLDGNIKYFEGKHIPLAIFAIMFGVFLLPFALCLLLIQWLHKASHTKLFSWVDHLKPFFDVYTGPFTSIGRLWTGLLLLTRVALLLVTAANVNGDPKNILSAIIMAVLLLFLVIALLPDGLYRHKHLNVLEYSSLINLGLLSALLLMFPNSFIITHTLVSVELMIFICVFCNHLRKIKFYVIKRSVCYVLIRKSKLCCNKLLKNHKCEPLLANPDDYDDEP